MLAAFWSGTQRAALANVSSSGHAIAMHGDPALADGFDRFPYANPEARRGGRLVYGVQGTFDSLNPLIIKGNASDLVPRFVPQSLMMRSLDEPFTMYGLLARRVEVAADRSRVTFELAPEAHFADGAPVTTRDVAFTFELLKAQGRPFFRSVANDVRAVIVDSPGRIGFDIAGSANRELPLNLAQMPILPRHATDRASFSDTTLKPQLGSGPYRVAQVNPGSSIGLSRDPNFWARDLPMLTGFYNFDEIRYDFYRDANSLFEAFATGLVDLRFEDDPARWVQGYGLPAVRDGRIVKETIPIRRPAGMNGFAFNARRGQFADARTRRALTLMFDFEWIDANLLFGLYRRTAGFFDESPLSSIGRPASVDEMAILAPYRDDIAPDVLAGTWRPDVTNGSGRDRTVDRQALSLLAEAGWVASGGQLMSRVGDRPLGFEIMTTTYAQERLALNYAASLSRVGVAARVRRVDEVQFWRRMQRFDFDMVQYNWAGSPSPGTELPNRWSSAAADNEGSLNYPAIRSRAVDAAIDAVLGADSLENFTDAARALDRALIADSYILPLYHAPDVWLARASAIRRPAHAPLFGVSIDTMWRET